MLDRRESWPDMSPVERALQHINFGMAVASLLETKLKAEEDFDLRLAREKENVFFDSSSSECLRICCGSDVSEGAFYHLRLRLKQLGFIHSLKIPGQEIVIERAVHKVVQATQSPKFGAAIRSIIAEPLRAELKRRLDEGESVPISRATELSEMKTLNDSMVGGTESDRFLNFRPENCPFYVLMPAILDQLKIVYTTKKDGLIGIFRDDQVNFDSLEPAWRDHPLVVPLLKRLKRRGPDNPAQ